MFRRALAVLTPLVTLAIASSATGYSGRLPAAAGSSPGQTVTIDSMTTVHDFSDPFTPGGGLDLPDQPLTYYLSDGTTWNSGAGSFRLSRAGYQHAEVVGDTVRYYLIPPPDSVLCDQSDFDAGSHSAQGTLKTAGPMVLETVLGSTIAELRGLALIASNEMTFPGDPHFNFYSALTGSVVPYKIRYTLYSGTWTATTFEHSFNYATSGFVDFTHPVSTPQLLSLGILGPAQMAEQSTAQFNARAVYEGGVQRDVTSSAIWSVTPSDLASITAGQLTTNKLNTSRADLTLHASYSFGGQTQQAERTVLCRADLLPAGTSEWPMFQANPRHTGYVPLSLDPASFALDWSVDLAIGTALNPVAAADGRVFCSLFTQFGPGPQVFALDARDGHAIWSKGYSAFSVNPPSTAYGNVYVQTVDNSSDTWLRAYDAATGDVVFESAHLAQWDRYYAPTLFGGKAYVDGGSYGGMYSFDALSGSRAWFQSLDQVDQWTPAVDSQYVYAYVGNYYDAVLYAANRMDGSQGFMIPDPNFVWDSYSMNLSPVLGDFSDVLAIHDGRLIRFDLGSRTISWELQRSFQGQPSVAKGLIYAIDGGALEVLDERTHADLWSWRPAGGGLSGTLIVTDSHVLASTQDTVYVVDLPRHVTAWSYPAGGTLALGNGQLYVASSTGRLTALAAHALAAPATLPVVVDLDPNVINLKNHALWVTAYLEPTGFDPASIALSTVRLAGSIAPASKLAVVGDHDGNGRPDLALKFSRAGLNPFLTLGVDSLEVTGSLVTGEKFAGTGKVRVIDPGGGGPSSVAPNPLNPSGVLTFTTVRPGPVRVTIFDLQGRRVRTLMETPLPAGEHELMIDGRGERGETLTSGVYFYQIKSADGVRTGRFAILK